MVAVGMGVVCIIIYIFSCYSKEGPVYNNDSRISSGGKGIGNVLAKRLVLGP